MTADSAIIAVFERRGLAVCLYESGGAASRLVSEDGGATWESVAAPTLGGATLTGTLVDAAVDERFGGALYVLRKSGSTVTVLRSTDCGATFETVIS